MTATPTDTTLEEMLGEAVADALPKLQAAASKLPPGRALKLAAVFGLAWIDPKQPQIGGQLGRVVGRSRPRRPLPPVAAEPGAPSCRRCGVVREGHKLGEGYFTRCRCAVGRGGSPESARRSWRAKLAGGAS